MPSFRGISCSILLGEDKKKAIECGEVVDKDTNTVSVYAQIRDGPFAVDIVPAESTHEHLRVQVENFNPSLLEINILHSQVEIDGKPQLERDSRAGWTSTNQNSAFVPVDSVVYSDNYGTLFSRRWLFSSVQGTPSVNHNTTAEKLGTIVLKFWRKEIFVCYTWTGGDDACTTDIWQQPPAVSASDISEHYLSHVMTYGQEESYHGDEDEFHLGMYHENIDSEDTPYATFIFKYRSQEVLESKLHGMTAAIAPPTTDSEQRITQLEERVALFERITTKRKLRKERRTRRDTTKKDLDQAKTIIATKSKEMKAKEQDMKARKKELETKKKELEAQKKKFEAEEKEYKQKKGDWELEKDKLNILQRKLADINKEEAEDDEELTDMEGEAA